VPDQPDPFTEDAITELLRKLPPGKRLEGLTLDEILVALPPEMLAALAVRLKEYGDSIATWPSVLQQQRKSSGKPTSPAEAPDLPALGLIVTSAFGLLLGIHVFIAALLQNDPLASYSGAGGVIIYGVTILGAFCMWRLNGYGLALTASILPIIQTVATIVLWLTKAVDPASRPDVTSTMCCAPFPLFFACIALSKLLQSDVRRAFKDQQPPSDYLFSTDSQ
jgi:hypothetical protein